MCVRACACLLDTQLLRCPLDPYFFYYNIQFCISLNSECYYYCWTKMATATGFVTLFVCLLADGLVQGRPPNFVVFLADE